MLPEVLRQLRDLLVAAPHVLAEGHAEQGQHRQVGQRVPAVGRRVDEHRALLREEQVAGPQVTVDPRGCDVPLLIDDRLARLLHHRQTGGVEVPGRVGPPGERQDPLVGVEPAPGRGRRALLFLGADVVRPLPPGRWGAGAAW